MDVQGAQIEQSGEHFVVDLLDGVLGQIPGTRK